MWFSIDSRIDERLILGEIDDDLARAQVQRKDSLKGSSHAPSIPQPTMRISCLTLMLKYFSFGF